MVEWLALLHTLETVLVIWLFPLLTNAWCFYCGMRAGTLELRQKWWNRGWDEHERVTAPLVQMCVQLSYNIQRAWPEMSTEAREEFSRLLAGEADEVPPPH